MKNRVKLSIEQQEDGLYHALVYIDDIFYKDKFQSESWEYCNTAAHSYITEIVIPKLRKKKIILENGTFKECPLYGNFK